MVNIQDRIQLEKLHLQKSMQCPEKLAMCTSPVGSRLGRGVDPLLVDALNMANACEAGQFSLKELIVLFLKGTHCSFP